MQVNLTGGGESLPLFSREETENDTRTLSV